MRYRMVVFALALLSAACAGRDETRQTEVAERGRAVMPFDLDRTTHVFERTADGGVQRVVSDDDDVEQVRRIREHLQEQASRFAEGDFHSPERIHGEHMPGLHEMVMGHDRVAIGYRPIDGGGEITYRSEDEGMVEAIHAWFAAQLADHGAHARPRR